MAGTADRARRWLQRRRVGLRNRVTLAFGLLALGLSLVLAALAWTLVIRNLLSETESSAVVETSLDRSALQSALASGVATLPQAIDALPRTDASNSLVLMGGRWYATSPSTAPSSLPRDLVATVGSGQGATQRITIDGQLFLAVGMPLQASGSAYFELFSLADTQRAARTLSLGLVGAAIVTAGLGLGIGRFATALALRPLAELNRVAREVAAGKLDARLSAGDDPDLGTLAASFNRTVEDLEQHVIADARFAVDVSHELRTPLTTMLNSMQVIKNREDQLPASVREPLDLLGEELERFRTLVVDLLEISRDDAGDQVVLERVNIADLVRRAADGVAGRPVTTVANGAAGLFMQVDKRRLERTVANLVANAETHGGGCTGVVVDRGQGCLRLRVEDAGPGIAPERRTRVFERFARGAGSPATGVGLGLAIVQRHVALHGGRVSIEDRAGGGVGFVVELPTGA